MYDFPPTAFHKMFVLILILKKLNSTMYVVLNSIDESNTVTCSSLV